MTGITGITMTVQVKNAAGLYEPRKCNLPCVERTAPGLWSLFGTDQLGATNSTLPGATGVYSPGGNEFTGLVDDPHAANTGFNYR
jgi:hypothetical protein